jgi:protein CpxP
MNRALIGLALSLTLIGSQAARADQIQALPPSPPQDGDRPGFGGPHGGRGGELHAIFAQLDLSADQKAQLKSLRQAKEGQNHQLRHDMKEARRAFAQGMMGNGSDDAMRALHKALQEKREQIATIAFEELLDVRRILTPDQRAKFGQLYIEFKHHERDDRGEREEKR